MFSRLRPAPFIALLAGVLAAACSDTTAPAARPNPGPVLLAQSGTATSGSTTDTSATQVVGGGGGGGGGAGGGSSAAGGCGTLENIRAVNIVVYTTRSGIGFTGTATNCGTRKEAFEVAAVDTDPDPACTISMPHFIAPRNTDPGTSVGWQANSTLVPCQGKMHTFTLTLWDTKTGQQLATTMATAFL